MTTIKTTLAASAAFAISTLAGAALTDPLPAQAPAPVGVFGADLPPPGKLVLTFSPSFTQMEGIKIDQTTVSPQYVVTNVVSAYTPVGTHILRMAPKSLSADAQAFSLAYTLNSRLTFFAGTTLVEKSVNMQAFKGLSGLTSLGYKVGSTEGFGDSAVAVIGKVYQDQVTRFSLNAGLSLPTGSTTDNISLLLPSNTAPIRRAFYAMQLGTGTVDALIGATYTGVAGPWSWGASYRARLPLDDNAQGYRYGDQSEFNGWGGYSWIPGVETTFRANATAQGHSVGDDPDIRGYAQGSDPQFYGGEQVSLFGGVVVGGSHLGVPQAQFGVEGGAPIYQRLNGPQLGRAWQLNLALKYRL